MNFTVLVVDDEKLIAKSIKNNIEKANKNFKVINIANNGLTALELIKEVLPNVVFTDIRMPEIDGIQLSNFIHQEFPFIHCIIISGFDDFNYAQNAIKYNVKDYLLKPINFMELKTTLSNIEKLILASRISIEKMSDNKPPEELVDLIKEYIHKNYDSSLDLSTLASDLGFSSPYLTKIFCKYTGTTPSKYIKEYRMNIAKQLLQNTSYSIASISDQIGYSDQFYFSKTFKSHVGMTPSKYRDSYNDSLSS